VTSGWAEAALAATGYLLGSIPFGFLVARAVRGVDVRAAGSGNTGATNVARLVGVGPGLLVLALDAGKGALAVVLAREFAPLSPRVQALAGLAAVAGHVAPVWLGFRGGKGVAVVYLVVFVLTRISSLGSLLAGPVAVAAAALWPGTRLAVAVTASLYVVILFTHRGNIGRLLKRVEHPL